MPEKPVPIITVQDLCWSVPGRRILDSVSLCLFAGEFVGLVGPNGAGKSSLLRALYGHIRPTSGGIYLNGLPLDSYSRNALSRKMAVVLQESSSSFALRVREVIELGLIPHKKLLSFDTEADKQRIQQAAEQMEVSHLLRSAFDDLSGGEKQRVMIARAIVQAPEVLVMDEPTNHLDVQHQIDVLKMARQLGVTVILSIHDLNLAAAFCDRLVVLSQGRIIVEGAPEQVVTKAMLSEVFAVSAEVDTHPVSGCPRITYAYPLTPSGARL